MTIVNLTPHPIHVYAATAPDTATGEHTPVRSIPPSGVVARLAVTSGRADAVHLDGVEVPSGSSTYGTPEGVPAPQPGVKYVVALPLAIEMRHSGRGDLLTVDRLVRNAEHTVVGCRGFGQVITPPAPRPRHLVCGDCAAFHGPDYGELLDDRLADGQPGMYRCLRGHHFSG